MATHELPGHQSIEDGSPISSMSEDDHIAEHQTPFLREASLRNLGSQEQISFMARLPAISHDRFSFESIRPESAANVQSVEQNPELTEQDHRQPRSEAGSQTGTREGEYKSNIVSSSMND